MKKYISLLMAALILTACNPKNDPDPSSKGVLALPDFVTDLVNTDEEKTQAENAQQPAAPETESAQETQNTDNAPSDVRPDTGNAEAPAAQAPAPESPDPEPAPAEASPEPARAAITVSLPGTKEFTAEGLTAAKKHIKLKLKSDKSYGSWLDTEKWLEDNHYVKPAMPYSDELYTYTGDATGSRYPYEYHSVIITAKDGSERVYDFSNVIAEVRASDREKELDFQCHVRYAMIKDDIMYVQFDGSYRKTADSTFIMAIDMEGRPLWRSRSHISNSRNFLLIDDTIITGFGSSFDPDFVYTLDAKTGKILDKISVKKAIDYIILNDGLIHIATYNREYIYTYK